MFQVDQISRCSFRESLGIRPRPAQANRGCSPWKSGTAPPDFNPGHGGSLQGSDGSDLLSCFAYAFRQDRNGGKYTSEFGVGLRSQWAAVQEHCYGRGVRARKEK